MTDQKHPKRPRDPAQLAKLIVDIATGEVEDRKPMPERGTSQNEKAHVVARKSQRAKRSMRSKSAK